MRLGINIDHIAYLRETRKINDPDPLEAIFIAKRSGASQITIHLREDRRHIHDSDISRIIESSFLPINIECSSAKDIVDFICTKKPHRITLVPEKRNEVTTEGGLLLHEGMLPILERFCSNEIEVSLFVDPCDKSIEKSIEISHQLGTKIGVELHTGKYANISLMLSSNLPHTHHSIKEFETSRSALHTRLVQEIHNIESSAKLAFNEGLNVYAGHGLNYFNVAEIVKIKEIEELNIGQSIIARSIFIGLEQAIRDMIGLIQ
ncbi:pyridoxine 5'-phosphate synthase [Helicobacter didelphidarum]|uniref:Pyridoxine 5'-phosphate synthase n=1 Tax=Helicobacter didelphidarum TaxID=2040648 RepID=A0A3D8ISP3_9HELI|nr:pyridoxine 5'-phosphate synthase [Helicobacter didelphidarum]RDU67611.1 pyridoxine 5'-phosphate synthase [Helicobacter didelphidarum]